MHRIRLFLLPLVLLAVAGLIPNSEPNPATGKLAGTVVDDLGDPLPGANVVVDGTQLGASTDIDGNYFIIGVPVGEYTVTASFVGYQPQSVEKVPVRNGYTTELNFELGPQSLGEITVVYERPIIQKDAIGAPRVLLGEEMSNLPIRGVTGAAEATADAAAPGRPNARALELIPGIQTNNPPPVDREGYAAIVENDFKRPTDAPLSTFSIDVDAASYANVRRFLDGGALPVTDAVRIEELVNYFDYDYADPTGEHPFAVVTEVSECPWAPDHRLVHIGLQGERIDTADLPPSNLVFLMDVSGSMNSPDKLPLLKQAFALLTDNLREQDRVGIVVYAGAAGVVLEPTSDRQAILDALGRLEAGGSTAGGEGIKLAYDLARKHFDAEKNNRVILATDGDFNVGASSDAEMMRLIERERQSGVFLSVLGFGTGNLQDSKMETIADHGNGHYAYIDSISEARKVLVNEMGGTLVTIAKDVKLQVEFNPAHVAAYRLVGYENRLLADEDFNDDTKDAGELGAGHSVTALYEIVPVGVESPAMGSVDELKYQAHRVRGDAATNPELLTVKLRYKRPDGDTSRLLEATLADAGTPLVASSESFRFAASVAEFGLLLRDSAHKGRASFENAKMLAEGARGEDPHGYRAEFVRLIDAADALTRAEVATR
ncbi:MAG: von Willebrand factor type A domain-containing protein [Rhodothermales bacterium]